MEKRAVEASAAVLPAGRAIRDDLQAWCEDRRRLQHSDEDIRRGRRMVERMIVDCGWKRRGDIHASDAPAWRAASASGMLRAYMQTWYEPRRSRRNL